MQILLDLMSNFTFDEIIKSDQTYSHVSFFFPKLYKRKYKGEPHTAMHVLPTTIKYIVTPLHDINDKGVYFFENRMEEFFTVATMQILFNVISDFASI